MSNKTNSRFLVGRSAASVGMTTVGNTMQKRKQPAGRQRYIKQRSRPPAPSAGDAQGKRAPRWVTRRQRDGALGRSRRFDRDANDAPRMLARCGIWIAASGSRWLEGLDLPAIF